jgi:hypothetical protein
MGFGLRILLTLSAFCVAILLGGIAARGNEGFRDGFKESARLFGFASKAGGGNGDEPNFQMRVEQRVIIRVPRQTVSQASNMTVGGLRSRPIKYDEKKIGKCLIMDRFIASRPGGGSKENLELVTRDGSIVRAYLGDGCLAREFYAGAYMERPGDGKLCADRDLMHARTGAKCEIDRFRLLVPKK